MEFNPSDFSGPAVSLVNDSRTASANGTAIDCRGFGSALFVLQIGSVNSSVNSTVKIQESDSSGSGFADVAGTSYAVDGVTDDNTMKLATVRLHSRKRYLRAVLTYSGSGTIVSSATFVLMNPQDSAYTSASLEFSV